MNRRDGAATVRHVLAYIEGRGKLAELQNDRFARLHYEQCWALVFLSYYGPNLLPPAYRCPKLQPLLAPPAEIPRWKAEMLAKPLRRVVERREVALSDPEFPEPVTGFVERLECGHETPVLGDFAGERPAKRRRCAECAKQSAGIEIVGKAA